MKSYRNTFLHLVFVSVLIFLCWNLAEVIHHPSLGVFWGYGNAIVYGIDQSNPSAAKLLVGDRIISGDGLRPADIYRMEGKKPGDIINLLIERNGRTISLPVSVTEPHLQTILSRLLPLAVAVVFWCAGSIVLAFSRGGGQPVFFFLACQAAAIALGSGAISSYGPEWIRSVLSVSMMWAGAFAVQLHLYFPTRVSMRYTRKIGWILFGGTGILSIFFLSAGFLDLHLFRESVYKWAALLTLGLELIGIIGLLVRTFRKAETALERNQAGFIVLAGIIGTFPLTAFAIIPDLIVGHPLLPYEVSFAGILLIPMGYGYAIFRYRMIGANKTINRGAAYALILLFLAGIYSIWYALSTRFLPPSIALSPMWSFALTITLVIFTNKLYRVSLNFVNNVLYGGWYDYRSVVENVSSSIRGAENDAERIGEVLCQIIGKSMRLEHVKLLLPEGEEFHYLANRPNQIERKTPEQYRLFLDYVEEIKTGEGQFIPWKSDFEASLESSNEREQDRSQYLVQLQGKDNQSLGVLLIGRKSDGEDLDGNDLEILQVVIHQAQITLENMRLLKEVRKHADMVSRLHLEVVKTREDERKSVSRDLHDLIIQPLAGINFKVAQLKADLSHLQEDDLAEIYAEIRQAIAEVRQICTRLRPPALDVLGLAAAIQSKVDEFEEEVPFEIQLQIGGNEDQEVSDEVKLCIYRLIQEGLRNAQKHSDADFVEVSMHTTSESVSVTILDNGRGFVVPDRLDRLALNEHFGLLGMKELVESAKGKLRITSSPGEGCVISAHFPI